MPSKETDLLVAIQDKLYTPETAKAARCLSYFGEHDLGWLAVAGLGGAVDKRKRSKWLAAPPPPTWRTSPDASGRGCSCR